MPIKKFPTVMPTIYDKFQCKGGACRNTCCQQWEINITRGEYNKLRHRIKDEKMQSLFHRVPRKEATDDRYALVELDEEGYCPLIVPIPKCAAYSWNMGIRYSPTSVNSFHVSISKSIPNSMRSLWIPAVSARWSYCGRKPKMVFALPLICAITLGY